MIRKPVDLSEMTLDWVQETNDVMFGDLTKADRLLLYLIYTRSMGMIEVGQELRLTDWDSLAAFLSLDCTESTQF